jgi:TonB family protein
MIRHLLLAAVLFSSGSVVLSGQNSESGAPKDSLACPADVAQPSQGPHKWVFVSSGVMSRNRIGGKAPKYPKDAKKAHVEGRVVLKATISDSGNVEDLCVIQGPELLQQAAFDAVKTWTYKPFLLNGEPREVKTQMNIEFNLQ